MIPSKHNVLQQLAAGIDATLVAYPDACHVLDAAKFPLRQHEGRTAYSKNGDGIVHIGTNEPARQDAIRRVLALFGGM